MDGVWGQTNPPVLRDLEVVLVSTICLVHSCLDLDPLLADRSHQRLDQVVVLGAGPSVEECLGHATHQGLARQRQRHFFSGRR